MKTSQMNLVGKTNGLQCFRDDSNKPSKLVSISFYQKNAYVIVLQPESGHTMSLMPGRTVITKAEFDDRPIDPYNSTPEAVWALDKCGWTAS